MRFFKWLWLSSLWVVIISSIILIIVFGVKWAFFEYRMKNEDLILNQFTYIELKKCVEKLGAYGEDVNLNIKKRDATPENLRVCLKKLNAYKLKPPSK